jgi:glycosyltransferase involved in cell wall biosynthesis
MPDMARQCTIAPSVRILMSLLSLRPGLVGGAETYVRALVRHLPEVAAGDELLLLVDRDLAGDLEAPGWGRVVLPVGARALVLRRILEACTPWRDRLAERVVAALRPDVTLFPQQSIFPLRAPGPAVLTAVDVQHLLHPGNFGAFDRTYRARAYPASLARAAHVIAISEFTRRTLLERCAVPPERVTTIHLGVEQAGADPAPPRDGPPPVTGPFLYYPAATWAHKGHATLLTTLAALRDRGASPGALVLTGQRTPLWERELLPLVRRLGLEGQVVHLGFVPFDEVRRLYREATAVVFPSTFEGFGLPVVEAVRAGARVVTSRLPVFDEIGVPPEAQVDFASPDEVRAALARPGPTRLAEEPISWRESARRTLDVLRAAAGGRPP